ncbi:MAG TPA: HAD-IIIC family phosphatase [Terriglobales bacterium]|nr:HAD-IIIC family phosphatase [Terriglobales bacterium]
MKLAEALEIGRRARAATGEPLPVLLACGFTPLHLATFLQAHLQRRRPTRPVQLITGLFGDLAGTLETHAAPVEAAVAVVEWSDLDPRLGVRGTGAWGPSALPDVIASVERAAGRLRAALERRTAQAPIALALPTLPLAPLGHMPGGRASAFEADLDAVVQALGAWAARHPRIALVRARRLDALSPPGERLDVGGEVRNGFPYRVPHADTVADLLAELVAPAQPKKGLITDLDDTLWGGILGEVGSAGVRWDLAGGLHMHGALQQCVAALAESGVLIAVASKNDPERVDEALRRADLRLPRDRIFPVEAGWGPKSAAVAKILHAWNVSAGDVVFVDDSAMELAEVAAAHPGLECVRFPVDDPAAAWHLLERLRDLFGRPRLSAEDGLRLASLRERAAVTAPAAGTDGFEAFLAGAEARLTLDDTPDADDPRALELVNKTNQWNLNGRRFSESQWRRLLAEPGAFLLRVAYEDRFGPLGTVAVLAGRAAADAVHLTVWVMSCRAFSRRIEHQALRHVFRRFGAEEVTLEYEKTDRNEPLREFLAGLPGSSLAGAGARVRRAALEAACPPLHHTLIEKHPAGASKGVA